MAVNFNDLPFIRGKCHRSCQNDGSRQQNDSEPTFHREGHACAMVSKIVPISNRIDLRAGGKNSDVE
jgi:hypothetical protein